MPLYRIKDRVKYLKDQAEREKRRKEEVNRKRQSGKKGFAQKNARRKR